MASQWTKCSQNSLLCGQIPLRLVLWTGHIYGSHVDQPHVARSSCPAIEQLLYSALILGKRN